MKWLRMIYYGPEVEVAARSTLRCAAMEALARMLGCNWGDAGVTAVSGQEKHALLERLVQLRLGAELRAVCLDAGAGPGTLPLRLALSSSVAVLANC
jgi:hypothetical protein